MKNFFATLTLLTLFVSPLWAREPKDMPGSKGNAPLPPPLPNVGNCLVGVASSELDINNVRATVYNGGDMWWDLIATPRYEIPKTTDPNDIRRHSMFAASVWVAGTEQGTNNLFLMAQTYRGNGLVNSFWPGPVDTITAFTNAARCRPWDRLFRIERQEVIDFDRYLATTAPADRRIEDIPASIATWPARNNPYLPTISGFEGIQVNFSLARFVDNDRNGRYDPLAGDRPLLPGAEDGPSEGADQSIFWITNDAGNQKRFYGTTTPAIGMEVHTEAFAYQTSDFVNDMTFYRQKLINKGTTVLANCYFGQWCDPDLGFPNDDYVGFDVPRGFAYCYNGDDFDEGVQGYGFNPPTVGVDFFRGPRADPNDGIDNDRDCVIDEEGELIIASNFVYYNNDDNPRNGNPRSAQEFYNYLRNIWRNGDPVTYDGRNGLSDVGDPTQGLSVPQTAIPTRYMFPGASDPIGWPVPTANCANPQPLSPWDEVTAGNPPGDRRFLTSAGPFTLRPGATNELTIGVVWSRTTSGGALGSLNKTLIADDEAQRLFDADFKIKNGPAAPDVQITELDQELVFTLTPHVYVGANGRLINTESYVEFDPDSRLQTDRFYRFQGYLVYQLVDGTVSPGELDNPDRARLLADVSSDVRDGVGRIINREFDPETGEIIPRVAVSGSDEGIRTNFSIRTDAFEPGSSGLINFRRYFFTVIAYGYNGDPNQPRQFLPGRSNRQTYSAVPHKPAPEQGGTVVRTGFGTGLQITRLQGIGNGGNILDSIPASQEETILRERSLLPLRYGVNNSPVRVRIANPKAVRSDQYKLELYGRVTYLGEANLFRRGQIIEARFNSVRPTLGDGEVLFGPDFNIQQTPGIARVISVRPREELDQQGLVDLEVLMLNDAVGGRFNEVLLVNEGGANFKNYLDYPALFGLQGEAPTLEAVDFAAFDYWRLYSGDTILADSARARMSARPSQVSPRLGLVVEANDVLGPQQRNFLNPRNGFQEVRNPISFAPNARPWFQPVPFGASLSDRFRLFNTQTPFDQGNTTTTIDISGALRRFLGGGAGPYLFSRQYASNRSPGGLAPGSYPFDEIARNVQGLGNVDIVLTPDRTKWTRVVVIQGDSLNPLTNQPVAGWTFRKSRLSSINSDGTPSGENSPFVGTAGPRASRGMGWFPGYAIDLDRGIRLNMMFLESRQADPDRGNNLRWLPINIGGTRQQDTAFAKSYFYVGTSQYDEGRRNEFLIDSLSQRFGVTPPFIFQFNRLLTGELSYIVNLVVPDERRFLASEARIKLRVDKPYASYPTIGGDNGQPTYQFTTEGLEVSRGVNTVRCNALDLIRVVPNPYYAYSRYESSQVDTRVRITNLPTVCNITIVNLSGTIIRTYRVDNRTQTGLNATTFQDWDLNNANGLPVAGGVYLIHVQAPGCGAKTIKFFGVLRPTDLGGLQN